MALGAMGQSAGLSEAPVTSQEMGSAGADPWFLMFTVCDISHVPGRPEVETQKSDAFGSPSLTSLSSRPQRVPFLWRAATTVPSLDSSAESS